MWNPKQGRLCAGRSPDEMTGKRLCSFLRLALTSPLRLPLRKCGLSAWTGARLFHLRLCSNKMPRSVRLRLDLHLAFFFRSFVRLETPKASWPTGLAWHSLPSMSHLQTIRTVLAYRVVEAAARGQGDRRHPEHWGQGLDPRRENLPALVRGLASAPGNTREASKLALSGRGGLLYRPIPRGRRGSFAVPARSTLGAIIASRAHALGSGLAVEHGDPRRPEHWGQGLDPRRGNLPALVRSLGSAAGNTPEALYAGSAAISPDATRRKASQLTLSGGGGLFYGRLFALRALDPITPALPQPSLRAWSRSFAVPEGSTLGAIIASRARPLGSGLAVEQADPRRPEHWGQGLDPRRENLPARVRSLAFAAGNTTEALYAAIAAISSDVISRKASKPLLSGGGGLFYGRLFALRALDPTTRALPQPRLRAWSRSFAVPGRSTLGAILVQRALPLRSGLAVEQGDPRRPEHWGQGLDPRRENLPAWVRSLASAAGNTREALYAGSAAIPSGALSQKASRPALSGGGGLSYRRLFALRPIPGGGRGSVAFPAGSTLGAIIASRAHPFGSGLAVEQGDPRRPEHGRQGLDPRREMPALVRSLASAAGSTREALYAGSAAISSDALRRKASQPALSGGAGLFYRRLFALQPLDTITLALPTPILRGRSRLKSITQSLLPGHLPGEGDSASPRLVHVDYRAASIPMRKEEKSVGTTVEQSRSYSIAEADSGGRKAGGLSELKAATHRDMQVLSQRVYELIVDRVRREKEKLGR